MAKIANISDPVNSDDLPALKKAVSRSLKSIIDQVNGNLSLVANVAAAGPFTVNFPDAGTSVPVKHSLQRVPTGFLIAKVNAPVVVYAPAGTSLTWTTDTVFLQASNAAAAVIFLL